MTISDKITGFRRWCEVVLVKHPGLVLGSIIALPITGPLLVLLAALIVVNLLPPLLLVTPFWLASCCCCCMKEYILGFSAAWGVCLACLLSPLVVGLALALYPIVVVVAIVLYCHGRCERTNSGDSSDSSESV